MRHGVVGFPARLPAAESIYSQRHEAMPIEVLPSGALTDDAAGWQVDIWRK
jgi:hypothetical protein